MSSTAVIRAFRAGVLVVALSGALVGGASAAAGGQPNTAPCKDGGWKTLFTSTGASFNNQGDCVSYAAEGGTLFTPQQAWEAGCVAGGGSVNTTNAALQWLCIAGGGGFSPGTSDALAPFCTVAGGTPSSPPNAITCKFR